MTPPRDSAHHRSTKNLLPVAACLLAVLLAPTPAHSEEVVSLPFSVSIGGQPAKAKDNSANYATIEKPVAANAALEVGAKGDMIIINVVAASDKGVPTEGATPAIILIQGDNKTTLDKTMDGKKLAPGNYCLAAVAEGKTASVFFKVQ